MTLSDLGLNDNATPDPILAACDVIEAEVQCQARIVAAYFTGLRAGGVPLELAEKLTAEWHGWNSKVWLTRVAAPPVDA